MKKMSILMTILFIGSMAQAQHIFIEQVKVEPLMQKRAELSARVQELKAQCGYQISPPAPKVDVVPSVQQVTVDGVKAQIASLELQILDLEFDCALKEQSILETEVYSQPKKGLTVVSNVRPSLASQTMKDMRKQFEVFGISELAAGECNQQGYATEPGNICLVGFAE